MPKNVYRLLLLLTTVALLASVPTIAKANAYEATAQDDLFRNALMISMSSFHQAVVTLLPGMRIG